MAAFPLPLRSADPTGCRYMDRERVAEHSAAPTDYRSYQEAAGPIERSAAPTDCLPGAGPVDPVAVPRPPPEPEHHWDRAVDRNRLDQIHPRIEERSAEVEGLTASGDQEEGSAAAG